MRRKVRTTLILSALVQPRSVTALGDHPPLLLTYSLLLSNYMYDKTPFLFFSCSSSSTLFLSTSFLSISLQCMLFPYGLTYGRYLIEKGLLSGQTFFVFVLGAHTKRHCSRLKPPTRYR